MDSTTTALSQENCDPQSRGRYVVLWIVLTFFVLVGLGAYQVTGFLRLSRDTKALKDCLLDAVPGQVDKTIAVNVGPITTGLVRLGSRFFSVPPEPRAALDAFRSGEVGIYRLERPPSEVERAKILGRADKNMAARGWTRIVGVVEKQDFVAVYVTQRGVSQSRVKCCVMVLNDCQAVLVSVRANMNPLINLAQKQFDLHHQFEDFAAVRIR